MRLFACLVAVIALATLTPPALAGPVCDFRFAGEDDFTGKGFSGKLKFSPKYVGGVWVAGSISGKVEVEQMTPENPGPSIPSGVWKEYVLPTSTSDYEFRATTGASNEDILTLDHWTFDYDNDEGPVISFEFIDEDAEAFPSGFSNASICDLLAWDGWESMTSTFQFRDKTGAITEKYHGDFQVVPLPGAALTGLGLLGALGLARLLRRRRK